MLKRAQTPTLPQSTGSLGSMAEIEVRQADITKLEVDAIANAANTQLRHGGGVAGAISRAGGSAIQSESDERAPIGLGEAVETSAGDMPSRWVIHAATMELGGPTSAEIIRRATASTLAKAEELGLSWTGWGGNITSDNISPRHLLNVKRLAYEVRPAVSAASSRVPAVSSAAPEPQLPRVAAAPSPGGLDASAMAAQVESLYRSGAGTTGRDEGTPASVVDFVCEEDVRQALRLSRKIMVGERTIVTPAARDLGEAHRVFVTAGWPRS